MWSFARCFPVMIEARVEEQTGALATPAEITAASDCLRVIY